jgi:hypothetical protein
MAIMDQAERAWLAERNSTRGRSTGRVPEIMVMYERAFAMAIENGFVQDAALAKELSWQMLHEMAGQASAEAAYCYSRWGAHAVAKQREQQKNAIVETNQPTVEAMTPTTTEIISRYGSPLWSYTTTSNCDCAEWVCAVRWIWIRWCRRRSTCPRS